jgi:outer membrane protein assembly factor BamD
MGKARDVIAMHEFMVGDFYFKKGACEGAIGRLEGLLRNFPEYKDGPEVLYRLGVCHKKLGDEASAEQDLSMLRRRYPGSPLIEKAEREFREISEN